MGDSLGIAVGVYEPLIIGTRALDTITDQVTGYSHDLNVFGGYDKAQITLTQSQDKLEGWLERGLGRRIVTYDDANQVIWEGFVNRITARLGPLSYALGALLDVRNYARAIYTIALNIPGQSGQGIRVSTPWAGITESIAKYGRLETVLSAGNVSDAEADQILNLFLAERSEPESNRDQSFENTSGADVTLTLECLGYYHWLNHYKYNQTVTTGTINRSTLVANILAAEPNGFFNAETAGILTNTSQVQAVWNDDQTAINIIKSMTAGGDASLNRWQFGIYAERKAKYAPVSTEVDYLQYIGSPAQEIRNRAGNLVKPWNVLPAKWLFFPDFMVGRVDNSADLASDPRALFVESVTYRAPWSVAVNGSKVSRLDQKIARLGLSGISA